MLVGLKGLKPFVCPWKVTVHLRPSSLARIACLHSQDNDNCRQKQIKRCLLILSTSLESRGQTYSFLRRPFLSISISSLLLFSMLPMCRVQIMEEIEPHGTFLWKVLQIKMYPFETGIQTFVQNSLANTSNGGICLQDSLETRKCSLQTFFICTTTHIEIYLAGSIQ